MKDPTSSRPRRPIFDRFFTYIDRRPPSDRLLFLVTLIVFLMATCITLVSYNNAAERTYPTSGGTFTEGIIGAPRFVNPVLSITQADHDLVALLYSGMMRLSEDGALTPDLAESVTVSEDGTVYNIILREGITFHDGTPIQAEDVAYTIGLIQDPDLKSPLRGSWSGVSVEVLNERELNIVLEEAYAPFRENLTLGIIPKHIWNTLSVEELPFSHHNVEPIGSGPYAMAEIYRNKAGLVESYLLEAVDGASANITNLYIRFYQNEDALLTDLEAGKILATASLSPEALQTLSGEQFVTIEEPLPRVFSVFINQNRTAALRDPAARRALSVAVDREVLIADVLHGYGIPTTSPVPSGFGAVQSSTTTPGTAADPLEEARSILTNGGWTQSDTGQWVKEIDEVETTLSISVSTANTPIFERTASHLERVWRELGVEVTMALFEQSDLVQAVIRPRDYQALLFGTDIGRSLDLYPFWHSSQRADPGLNVALYTNITTDTLLERARIEHDQATQLETTNQVVTEIQAETPAIFLFSPAFTYVVNRDVAVVPTQHMNRASERFATISAWYMNQEDVWPIFKD